MKKYDEVSFASCLSPKRVILPCGKIGALRIDRVWTEYQCETCGVLWGRPENECYLADKTWKTLAK